MRLFTFACADVSRIARNSSLLFAVAFCILDPAACAREEDKVYSTAVASVAQKHTSTHIGADKASTDLSTALSQVGADELKDEFLAFLKSRKQSKAKQTGAQHREKSRPQKTKQSGAIPCGEQWRRHVAGLHRNIDELYNGMKKVRQANVLLAGVHNTHWSKFFAGSHNKDPETAASVQHAIEFGGNLLGELDGLGDAYSARLQGMLSGESRDKFMRDCEHQSLSKPPELPLKKPPEGPVEADEWNGGDWSPRPQPGERAGGTRKKLPLDNDGLNNPGVMS